MIWHYAYRIIRVHFTGKAILKMEIDLATLAEDLYQGVKVFNFGSGFQNEALQNPFFAPWGDRCINSMK